jgi:hypothetical protein
MRAINKPREIEVVQYQAGGDLPPGVFIREDGKASVWNELHGSAIRLEPGDFVNITDPRDYYPIKREVFEKTYTLLDTPAPIA